MVIMGIMLITEIMVNHHMDQLNQQQVRLISDTFTKAMRQTIVKSIFGYICWTQGIVYGVINIYINESLLSDCYSMCYQLN